MQRGWKAAAAALAATMMLASGAFAQRGGGFGFGRGGFGGGANMLRIPEVQTELKLTDEQKTKVTDLLQKLREQRQGQGQNFQDLSPEERQKLLADRRAAEDKQLADILNADQMKRYHQLQLQQQGYSALADKSVADQLKLTDEQRTKIQGILDEQRAAMRDLFQSGGSDREAMMQKMQGIRKQTDQKIAALLTDDQKNQWKEMTGAPFTFPAPAPPRAAGV
jgi:Spy/CpxP family protein refolding chaperone